MPGLAGGFRLFFFFLFNFVFILLSDTYLVLLTVPSKIHILVSLNLIHKPKIEQVECKVI
jgi:hypothetical protein